MARQVEAGWEGETVVAVAVHAAATVAARVRSHPDLAALHGQGQATAAYCQTVAASTPHRDRVPEGGLELGGSCSSLLQCLQHFQLPRMLRAIGTSTVGDYQQKANEEWLLDLNCLQRLLLLLYPQQS